MQSRGTAKSWLWLLLAGLAEAGKSLLAENPIDDPHGKAGQRTIRQRGMLLVIDVVWRLLSQTGNSFRIASLDVQRLLHTNGCC